LYLLVSAVGIEPTTL